MDQAFPTWGTRHPGEMQELSKQYNSISGETKLKFGGNAQPKRFGTPQLDRPLLFANFHISLCNELQTNCLFFQIRRSLHHDRGGGLQHRVGHRVGEQVRDGQRHGPAEGVRGGRRIHEDGNEVRQTLVFEMDLIKDKNLI